MTKERKVNLFLAVVAILAILIAIFALNRSATAEVYPDIKEYQEQISLLKDTIQGLKGDIAKYQVEIDRIQSDKDSIRALIAKIIEENEKMDSELANGNWDYNIRFLTEYLDARVPKKDTL